MTDPALPEDQRQAMVQTLMTARRAVRSAKAASDEAELAAARATVDRVKRALGERGPVWWDDCAPDYNRHMARNTPYADWYAALPPSGSAKDASEANPA